MKQAKELQLNRVDNGVVEVQVPLVTNFQESAITAKVSLHLHVVVLVDTDNYSWRSVLRALSADLIQCACT